MNIGSYQACLNFFGSDQTPALNNLRDCVTQLGKLCNCQKARKTQKSEECNVLYINFASRTAPNMVEYLKTKTTDSTITFTHGSNHVIYTITLR